VKSIVAGVVLLAVGTAMAADPLDAAFTATKPLLDARLRYEQVEQPTTAARTEERAHALTARLRAGFETGKAWDTALLVEGEFVDAWVDDYNSTANGRTAYPIVADPKVSELNRLHLTNTSLPGTVLTLGRQRIALDDHRFVGNVGWRQNEQTFDALRMVNKSVKNLTIDLTYADQVNRVFGERSITQLPKFDGNVVLANVGYALPLGRLTGFGYLLDLDNSAANSSATYGLRFTGQRPVGPLKLNYMASWATQQERDDAPDYSARYLLAELGVTYEAVTAQLGYERLGGDGTRGFATPLATLHRFQGWADVFLTTPVDGIRDEYVGVSWAPKFAGLDAVSAAVVYHRFETARNSTRLGEELDMQVSLRKGRVTGLVKYADYAARVPAQDVDKLWLEVAFAL
jgi:alginate export protein